MLEVVLKANNKNITFISGSSTIGANDDFVQSITVKAETPLTTLEELYVKFSNNALGETRQERLLGNSSYGYKCNIPQELIDFGANTWNWQILRRRYSSDRQSYTEIGSYLYPLTVGAGLKNANGENVTAAELQTLYLSAMDNERKSSQNAANAAYAAERAETAKAEASAQAQDASINAQLAKSFKDEAKSSEDIAVSAASSAIIQGNRAYDHANTAQQFSELAYSASTDAIDAKNTAIDAQGKAEKAQADAEKALGEAEKAQAYAEKARGEAETARDEAVQSALEASGYATTAKDAENYVKTTVRDLVKAKSFDTYGDLVNYLKTDAAAMAIPFAIGQHFMIVEMDIPDLWVSGYDAITNHSYNYSSATQFLKDLDNNGGKLWVGNYQLSKLETAKVYLGDLQPKTDNRLQTSSKDVVTAINELYERLDDIGEVVEEHVEPLVQSVETIEQALQQAKVQAPYWSIEAYNSRVTAGGKNVLNGSKAFLHKVESVAVDRKNLCKPISQRTLTKIAGTDGPAPNGKRMWSEDTYTIGITNNNYLKLYDTNHIKEVTANSVTFNTGTGYYGLGLGIPCDGGKTYTFSAKVEAVSQLVYFRWMFCKEDGSVISYAQSDDDQKKKERGSVAIETPNEAKWIGIVVCGHNADTTENGNITVSDMQLEEGSDATEYVPYIAPGNPAFGGMRSTSADGEESSIVFPKTELPSGYSIDFDRKVIVNANGTETPFTDEQKAVGNQYTVWQGGTETVLDNDGSEYGANLTITQEYTIVNEIGSGGGSSSGGGTGSGGISQSEVQSIADSYATTRANEALSTAKAYTDEKIGDIETALTAILGV